MWEGRSLFSICRLHLLHLPMSGWLARSVCEIFIITSNSDSLMYCLTKLIYSKKGARCNEDVNECIKTPCKNGGRCINTQGSFMCKCQHGYSGHNCQTDVDDCSPSEFDLIFSYHFYLLTCCLAPFTWFWEFIWFVIMFDAWLEIHNILSSLSSTDRWRVIRLHVIKTNK